MLITISKTAVTYDTKEEENPDDIPKCQARSIMTLFAAQESMDGRDISYTFGYNLIRKINKEIKVAVFHSGRA